jgi:hypothetical protein
VAVAVAAGCTKKAAPQGGLELVVATNLDVPRYFDTLRVEVSQVLDGTPHLWLDNEWPVPSADATLPTTFLIRAGASANEVALVRVSATSHAGPSGQAAPVLVREVRISVPTNRVAEVPIVLGSACYGAVDADGATLCPPGESCDPASGGCGSIDVDVTTLPTYTPGAEDSVDAGTHAAPSIPEAGLDAAVCTTPGPAFTFHPPTGPRGACTDDEIATFYSSCITSGVCDPGTADGGSGVSAACTSCLVGSGGDAWGALVKGPFWQINAGGCYATEAAEADASAELACAQAVQTLLQCEQFECIDADGGAYEPCRNQADTDPSKCACFARSAGVTCAPFANSPCSDSTLAPFAAYYQAVAHVLCGP